MLEVHAPNHISRKSRYSNALNTRLIKVRLGQRMRALDQVKNVAVEILEENQ